MLIRLIAPLTCAALLYTVAAHAQSSGPGESGSQHITALNDCREIADPAGRLACYDSRVPQLLTAAETGDVRVVDREMVRETRRRLFGLALPKLRLFGGRDGAEDESDEAITSLTTTIVSARPGPGGTMILRTEDDMVWQLDQVPSRLMTPRAGQSVEFRRASLGSYFVSINGQPGVRGRRLQ